ncbi:hypothetical protein [Desulfosporosinus nitroreducens]|uniref:hypothetical protein n=1 Tax=Desulfosporosinus nitroreducens TaxID=2018668 RepID=UPI00207C25AF|nr:hypothetical protein [Desulfosporosinus nitroreducens]MCO1600953.1 hypothetical protein [Desulfosporosinus nitroreducens]
MKINSLSSQVLILNKINYSNSNDYGAVKSSNTQDSFLLSKMKQLVSGKAQNAADPQTNSINIKPGEIKNIGSIDGSPLNISFDADGTVQLAFQYLFLPRLLIIVVLLHLNNYLLQMFFTVIQLLNRKKQA